MAFLERKRVGIVITAPAKYPSEPFAEARDLAAALGTGNVSSDGWYYTARYDDLTDAQLNDLFSVALHLLDTLSQRSRLRCYPTQSNRHSSATTT